MFGEIRIKFHFLRQSLDEKKSDEKEIVEMQKKYHHVIDLTEVLNFGFFSNKNVFFIIYIRTLKANISGSFQFRSSQLRLVSSIISNTTPTTLIIILLIMIGLGLFE